MFHFTQNHSEGVRRTGGHGIEAAKAIVPIPATTLHDAVARPEQAEMPGEGGEDDQSEDDQDFARGAFHGAQIGRRGPEEKMGSRGGAEGAEKTEGKGAVFCGFRGGFLGGWNMKEEMLARLVAQAEGRPMDMVTVRALIEEASDLGAERALERLGLADRRAEGDVRELRELLSAWRDAKKAARGAVIGWLVRIALALVLLGIAVKTGLVGLVRT